MNQDLTTVLQLGQQNETLSQKNKTKEKERKKKRDQGWGTIQHYLRQVWNQAELGSYCDCIIFGLLKLKQVI